MIGLEAMPDAEDAHGKLLGEAGNALDAEGIVSVPGFRGMNFKPRQESATYDERPACAGW